MHALFESDGWCLEKGFCPDVTMQQLQLCMHLTSSLNSFSSLGTVCKELFFENCMKLQGNFTFCDVDTIYLLPLLSFFKEK